MGEEVKTKTIELFTVPENFFDTKFTNILMCAAEKLKMEKNIFKIEIEVGRPIKIHKYIGTTI